ncbi:MAG TPA: response regulator [Burkholderiaceae bacterium]|nr:response regulator [Burkholderiaceae bacterium]
MSHQQSSPTGRGSPAKPDDSPDNTLPLLAGAALKLRIKDHVQRRVTQAVPVPTDMALKLLVKGFKPLEHQLLNGTVKLSERRQPRLRLVSDAEGANADVVMIDARDPLAMRWAARRPWLEHTTVIWVDAADAPPGHTVIRRPVQWPAMPMLLARALEQGPRRSINNALSTTMTRASVLVVDDSVIMHTYLRSMLEPSGVTVTVAENAEAGIKAAAAAHYACILMDVMMPGIDGYEACRRIKAGARAGKAPAIVMLTSKSSPFDRIRGKMAGCDDYLVKPVDQDRLHQVLSRYIAVFSGAGESSPGALTLELG